MRPKELKNKWEHFAAPNQLNTKEESKVGNKGQKTVKQSVNSNGTKRLLNISSSLKCNIFDYLKRKRGTGGLD